MSGTLLAIAIPTYNEATNIKGLLYEISRATSEIKGLNCYILVIDDNSPDGTGEIVKSLIPKLETKIFNVELFNRPIKNGLGQAYLDGFELLVKKDCDYILQMDADFSHNPKYIPKLIDFLGQNDFVVASRYDPGGATPDWKKLRKLLSKYGNLYISFWLGSTIKDYTGGFNLFKSETIKNIDFGLFRTSGYSFFTELKVSCCP